MTAKERFESAKEIYASYGVDVEAAIEKCMEAPVALHCWQGDDVTGFDHDGPLTGGIQTTGNYPGKAKTPEELMQDMDKALSLMPTLSLSKGSDRISSMASLYLILGPMRSAGISL